MTEEDGVHIAPFTPTYLRREKIAHSDPTYYSLFLYFSFAVVEKGSYYFKKQME